MKKTKHTEKINEYIYPKCVTNKNGLVIKIVKCKKVNNNGYIEYEDMDGNIYW